MQFQQSQSVNSSEEEEQQQNKQKIQEKFIGIKQMKNIPFLSKKCKQFYHNFCQNHTPMQEFYKFKKPNQQPSQLVCAKPIAAGQTIVQCFNCRMDQSCIICLDCFKKSNHQEHKYFLKKAYGGCCDCGDIEAWKPQGFCTQHSGQFIDCHIDEKDTQEFNQNMFELFYLLFWSKYQNKYIFRIYTQKLIAFVDELNSIGLYYNKLFTLLFDRILPAQMSVTANINANNILKNVLTYQFSGKSSKQWFNIFLKMFSYYPFKINLLITYFQHYQHIYSCNSLQSAECGRSIACQLLTSHQLVQQYIKRPNSVYLGHEMDVLKYTKVQLQRAYQIIILDLNYLCRLHSDVPMKYWQFHLRQNCTKLFQFYEKMKLEQQMINYGNDIFLMNLFTKYCQIQYNVIQLFVKICGILRNDQITLIILIKQLFQKVLQEEINQFNMPIYKPYQRVLCVVIFTYFKMDLKQLNTINIEIFHQKVLNLSSNEFQKKIQKILIRSLETFLFYSRILTNAGLNSTFYPYLFFYKIKSKLMSSIDIIWCRMLLLMYNSGNMGISFRNLLKLSELQPITNDSISQLLVYQNEINLLYTSQIYEIFLCYSINEQSTLYENEIEDIFLRLMGQKNNHITKQQLKIFEQQFLHPQVYILKNKQFKQYCYYNKQNKQFILYSKFNKNNNRLIFTDFRCSLNEKEIIKNPEISLHFIKDYNIQIYKKIWNQETIRNYCQFVQIGSKLQGEIEKSILNGCAKLYYNHNYFGLSVQQFKNNLILFCNIETKLNKFYLDTLGYHYSEQSLLNNDNRLRKQKLLQRKNKKLLQINNRYKQNQQKMIDKHISQKMEVQKQKQGNFCLTCRSDNTDNLVYLIRISIRNHEKLFKFGCGVSTLSFYSCNHTFHYDCIKDKLNKKQYKIQCPFCRQILNSFLPLKQKQIDQLDIKCINRIEQIMNKLKKYNKINIIEELIKSFYHFVLLGILDLEYCLKNRILVYHRILQLLKININKYKKNVFQIYDNFKNGRMNLNPIIMDNKMKKNNLQYLQYTVNNQFLHDIQYQDIMMINQEWQSEEQYKNKNNGKNRNKNKNKNKKNHQQQQEMTNIFEFTIKYIFKQLGILKQDLFLQQQKISLKLKICLQTLINPINSEKYKLNKNYNYNNNIFKFRDIPIRYNILSKYKKCDQCQQFSQTLMICLLCDWKGCLQCKKGGVCKHYVQHGQISIFMELRRTEVYLIGINQSEKIGCLYKDQYGNKFKVEKDFNEFQLDLALLEEIKLKLIHDH